MRRSLVLSSVVASFVAPSAVAMAAGHTGFDLSIVETASPSPATVGQNLTYTETVHNNGPQDVVNVVIADPQPAGITSVSNLTSSQGTCTFNTTFNSVQCKLGPLAANNTATVTYVVVPTSPGTLTNTAKITDNTTNGGDTDASNNSSTLSVQVNAAPKSADLFVNESASGNPNAVGSSYSYNVIFGNHGPSDSSGTGKIVLPSGVTRNGLPSGCTASGQTVTCPFATLNSGASKSVTVNVTATAKNAHALSTSSITGPDPDPDLSNNNASVTTANYLVTGSAFGEQVRAVLNSGPLASESRNTPGTTSVSVVSTDPSLSSLLTASALDASTTITNNATVTSTATTANATLLATVLGATAVQSTCSATSPSSSSGSTTFASLSINGVPQNLNPSANTVINLPGSITITLNEQIKSSGGGGITVNAIHLHIPALLVVPATDIIVSQSKCLVDP